MSDVNQPRNAEESTESASSRGASLPNGDDATTQITPDLDAEEVTASLHTMCQISFPNDFTLLNSLAKIAFPSEAK